MALQFGDYASILSQPFASLRRLNGSRLCCSREATLKSATDNLDCNADNEGGRSWDHKPTKACQLKIAIETFMGVSPE